MTDWLWSSVARREGPASAVLACASASHYLGGRRSPLALDGCSVTDASSLWVVITMIQSCRLCGVCVCVCVRSPWWVVRCVDAVCRHRREVAMPCTVFVRTAMVAACEAEPWQLRAVSSNQCVRSASAVTEKSWWYCSKRTHTRCLCAPMEKLDSG